MRIIGIDPGLAITGYGVLDSNGHQSRAVIFGCIRTAAAQGLSERLAMIYRELSRVLAETRPEALAVEKLFFSRNSSSAMQVGEARGVVILAGCHAGLPIYEYTPLEVKQAVVGYGRAEKHQVQQMVRVLLSLQQVPRPDDAADALALALCHAHTIPVHILSARRDSHV